ncbi:response regulator [Mycolicibacterium vaccae]|uniref:Response regulator receiver protein n=1 Tax=Mycolicibacterium vaccae ATCC 25954 TaxID=1194972 RepID=K0UYG5_MYCVA|nr:response regulator transcription factor [Mycolicibacterium vaccae]EJZ12177.1 response regulator receiver protein [Mycolicibacterium vaccae ATCC 25954]MCV7060949.1 response regulator transcription factor [Mycolicibacterium vaccae]
MTADSGVYTLARPLLGDHAGTVVNQQVRVWVVDDQASFRLASAATLAATDGFVLAGQSATGESALERLAGADADAAADLVLMDIHMPGIGGIEAARQLRARHPDLVVVLMSTYDADELPAAVTENGTTYLQKQHLCPEVLSDIWRTAS